MFVWRVKIYKDNSCCFVPVSDMDGDAAAEADGDAAAALLPEHTNASGTLRVGYEFPTLNEGQTLKEFIEEKSKELLGISTKLSTRSTAQNLEKCRKRRRWPTHRIHCVHAKEHHRKQTDNKSDRTTNTKKGNCPFSILLKKKNFFTQGATHQTKARLAKNFQKTHKTAPSDKKLEEVLCTCDIFIVAAARQ